eukprot:UN16497
MKILYSKNIYSGAERVRNCTRAHLVYTNKLFDVIKVDLIQRTNGRVI